MRSDLQYFQSILNLGSTYMDPSERDKITGVLVHKQVLLILRHTGVCGPWLLRNQHVCDVKTVMNLHTQIALIYNNIYTLELFWRFTFLTHTLDTLWPGWQYKFKIHSKIKLQVLMWRFWCKVQASFIKHT